MKLLLDVGNTAIKYAILADDRLQLLDSEPCLSQQYTEVVYACVGGKAQLTAILAQAQRIGIVTTEITVTPELAEIKCAYAEYQNLGIDRWLTVLAASALYPQTNVLIVDSGTATKYDFLAASGQHCGGWIVPGLDLMVSSTVAQTKKVFSCEQTQFDTHLGTDTPMALKNGCLAATVGAFCVFNQQYTADKLLFAGGYGEFLKQHLQSLGLIQSEQAKFSDKLIFIGMKKWLENKPI